MVLEVNELQLYLFERVYIDDIFNRLTICLKILHDRYFLANEMIDTGYHGWRVLHISYVRLYDLSLFGYQVQLVSKIVDRFLGQDHTAGQVLFIELYIIQPGD